MNVQGRDKTVQSHSSQALRLVSRAHGPTSSRYVAGTHGGLQRPWLCEHLIQRLASQSSLVTFSVGFAPRWTDGTGLPFFHRRRRPSRQQTRVHLQRRAELPSRMFKWRNKPCYNKPFRCFHSLCYLQDPLAGLAAWQSPSPGFALCSPGSG